MQNDSMSCCWFLMNRSQSTASNGGHWLLTWLKLRLFPDGDVDVKRPRHDEEESDFGHAVQM